MGDQVDRMQCAQQVAYGEMQGVQSIHVATYQVATGPQVRLVNDPGLLRHVGETPENGLLHKKAVCVWQ